MAMCYLAVLEMTWEISWKKDKSQKDHANKL